MSATPTFPGIDEAEQSPTIKIEDTTDTVEIAPGAEAFVTPPASSPFLEGCEKDEQTPECHTDESEDVEVLSRGVKRGHETLFVGDDEQSDDVATRGSQCRYLPLCSLLTYRSCETNEDYLRRRLRPGR